MRRSGKWFLIFVDGQPDEQFMAQMVALTEERDVMWAMVPLISLKRHRKIQAMRSGA